MDKKEAPRERVLQLDRREFLRQAGVMLGLAAATGIASEQTVTQIVSREEDFWAGDYQGV